MNELSQPLVINWQVTLDRYTRAKAGFVARGGVWPMFNYPEKFVQEDPLLRIEAFRKLWAETIRDYNELSDRLLYQTNLCAENLNELFCSVNERLNFFLEDQEFDYKLTDEQKRMQYMLIVTGSTVRFPLGSRGTLLREQM